MERPKFTPKEKPKNPEEEQHTYFILDIGTGDTPPLWYSAKERKEFLNDPNKIFIGFDIDRFELREGKRMSKYEGYIPDERNLSVVGNAEKLPFLDESINEISLNNVIGQYYDRFNKVNLPTIRKVLKEIKRVLKNRGTIKILETITPPPIQELKKFLEHSGFIIDKVVEKPKLNNYLEQPNFTFFYDSFAIEAKLG